LLEQLSQYLPSYKPKPSINTGTPLSKDSRCTGFFMSKKYSKI